MYVLKIIKKRAADKTADKMLFIHQETELHP
jgi:hypothetical protein